MSEPIKNNADILADQQAFQAVYERAKAFFGQIDGVEGVGFGQKQTGAQYQDTIAIVVFVRQKQPAEALPPEQRIPAAFEGYPTDVQIVQQTGLNNCENKDEYETIQGGIQISAPANAETGKFDKGTLGCIVKRRNDTSRDNVYLLSNQHVLFPKGVKAGNYIYHPFPPSPDTTKFVTPGPSKALGPIQKKAVFDNISFTPPGATSPSEFFTDCGTARIDIDSKCFGSRCTKDEIKHAATIIDLQLNGVNTIKDVRNVINDVSIIGQKVFKVGRTTRRTVGVVRSVNAIADINVDPNSPKMVCKNLIKIDFDVTSTPNGVNCMGKQQFSYVGDSGSAVLDEQGRMIGLLSLGPQPSHPPNAPTFACHILPILESLNIDIVTTSGAAHATHVVTGDSGPVPTAVSPGSPGLIEDGGALTAQAAAGVPAAPDLPEVAPASQDELQHLYALRDQLCATEHGRALHDAFVHVRREIGFLVRNSRPVKVVWHRHNGPAFFAQTLSHLRGGSAQMPRVIDGVTLDTLLTRMSAVLSAQGSRPLRAAIETHGAQVLALVLSGTSAQDYIARLQQEGEGR